MAEFNEQKLILNELGFELANGDIITESGSVNVQWYEQRIGDFDLVTNDIDRWDNEGIYMYLEPYKSPQIRWEDIANVVQAMQTGSIQPPPID